MLTVYGIKSCDTCRKARQFLAAKDIDFQFHDLRVDGLDMQVLQRWADRIGWEKLLNRKSLTWRRLPEVDRDSMTRNKALATMLEQPTLIKRPLIETEQFISVGFSEQKFSEFLKSHDL
jgi:arsenate reductase